MKWRAHSTNPHSYSKQTTPKSPSETLDTRLPGVLFTLDAPIKPRKSIRISILLARIKEIVRLMLPTRASRISIPFTIHASILDHGRRALVCRSKADALVQRVDGVVGAHGEVALAADGCGARGGGPVIEGVTALRQVRGNDSGGTDGGACVDCAYVGCRGSTGAATPYSG